MSTVSVTEYRLLTSKHPFGGGQLPPLSQCISYVPVTEAINTGADSIGHRGYVPPLLPMAGHGGGHRE